MKAIQIADDADRSLVWADAPDPPAPGPGEVLIDVAATAVNRADLLQRGGRYPVPKGASEILGLEAAGAVAAVGPGVTGLAPGDRVACLLAGGGYAERVVCPAALCLPVPDALSDVEAAALPEALFTAFVNIYMEAAAAPGETVLVHAGASGVGTVAIQLCRALGNPVLATASGPKLPRLRELGAARAIDREAEDFVAAAKEATSGRGADVILCPVGGAYLARNIAALAPRGRLVIIGLLGGPAAELPIAPLLMRRLRVVGSVLRSRAVEEKAAIAAALRERAWPAVAAGEIHPVIHTTLPIRRAGEAHALLQKNATVGKVVLTVRAA